MPLSVTLGNAISGLQTSQAALQTTSNNIANVNTEGYTRKIIEQTARRINGVGYGVEITRVTRKVDQGLLRQLRVEQGTLQELTLKSASLVQVNSLFGRPEDNDSIVHLLSDLGAAFDALSVSPETAATQFTAVKAGEDVATETKQLSDEIQRLRTETNRQITTAINDINTQLDVIVATNTDIIRFTAQGVDTAELEDQRDVALNKLAEYMDIKYFERGDGSITLFTGSGKTLVDGTAQKLSYSQPSAVSPTLTYTPFGAANYVGPNGTGYPAGGIPGIFVGEVVPESDITTGFSGGKLKALIDLRDSTLPALQSEVDELTEKLRDQINLVHNKGAGFPPALSLTGSQYVESGTEFANAGATGLARFALVDDSGAVVEAQTLDMSTYATVGDLVTTLNGFTNMSASINSDGRLQLTAQNGTHIAINELTSSANIAGKNGVGVSSFFGLNDFYQSSEQYNLYRSDSSNSRTGSVVTTGGDLHFSGNDGAAFATTVNYSAGASLNDLVTAINADATLQAENISASIISDGAGYRLQVVDANGDEFAIVESSGGSALSDTGLRTDSRGVSARLAVRQDIQDNTFLISRGALQSNTFTSGALTSDTTDFTTLGLTVPGTLNFTIDASTTASIAYTGADTLQTMATKINNDSTLSAANISAEVIVQGSNYRLKITDADSNNFWIADSVGAAGLNVATSQGVTIGDGSVATDLAAVFAQVVTFNAAPQSGGGLARTDATLTDYASTILSFNATSQKANDKNLQAQTNLTNELFNKNASISGVNLDEELASMVVYEQAYIAAARLITTTQRLFQVLDDTVKSIG